MPLRLGDRNESVRRWRVVMAARFAGYARTRGPLPTDTDEFGPRARDWQLEYEIRTGQPQDGVVSDDDLRALGVPIPVDRRPWLFTVHGTGQPDPVGEGLPANTAREVLDLYRWQPIGNYPAATFPMWNSIIQGVEELVKQMLEKLDAPDAPDAALAGYSQGAVVVAYVLKHEVINPKGRLHKFLGRIKKVVFWGNPMRQQGIAAFDEWIHPLAAPDTHGILDDRLEGLENMPFEVRDYAHDDDMYAAIRDSQKDEYKIAIAKIVMLATGWYSGENSIFSQLKELGFNPFTEIPAMFGAIVDAIKFFTGTAHGYNIYPAVAFLRS